MRNTIVNNGWNTTEWGLAFLRVSSFPLDPSLVFEDELEFSNYLAGKDTDKPYIGQLVAVKKKDSVTAKPTDPDYDSSQDDANFTIYLINSTTIKDDNTIDKWNAIVLNGKDLDEIKKIIDDFKEQVKQDLDDLYDKIEGGASEEFNTLKKLQDYLLTLEVKTTQGISNLQKELDTTQIGVGLSQDGSYSADKETYYLKDATSVMNALKILDAQLKQAITSFNFRADNKDIVPLEITKQADETVISASLLFSNVEGNQLVKKADGIYNKVRLEYNKGTLTLKVNDTVVDTFNTAVTNLIQEAKYDPATESIVIVFNTEQGDPTTINIPVGALIREWEPDNTQPTKVVELNREVVNGGGADKLSADVRLSSNTRNILVKDNNTLLVEGTTDNITYKDQNLTDVIDQLKAKDTTNDEALNQLKQDLQSEINRATQAESNLDHKITQETTRATTEEKRLEGLVNTNKTDIDQLEQNLQNEINRAVQKETELDNKINNEINRATAKEETLDNKITTETNRALQAEDELSKKIDTETNRAVTKETELESKINENSVNIQNEINRATKAEEDLQKQVDDLNETVAANFMFKSSTIEPSHANVGDTVDVVLNWSFAGLAAGKEVDSQVLNGNPIDKAARTYTFKGVTKTTQYRIIATYRGMTIDTVLEIVFSNPIKLGVVDNTTIDDKILTGLKTYDDTYPIRVDCTGGKYAVLAVEHNKIQSLLINNLPLGDFTLTAVDHANGTSTTTYDVYRSNNKYNGTIILDII